MNLSVLVSLLQWWGNEGQAYSFEFSNCARTAMLSDLICLVLLSVVGVVFKKKGSEYKELQVV